LSSSQANLLVDLAPAADGGLEVALDHDAGQLRRVDPVDRRHPVDEVLGDPAASLPVGFEQLAVGAAPDVQPLARDPLHQEVGAAEGGVVARLVAVDPRRRDRLAFEDPVDLELLAEVGVEHRVVGADAADVAAQALALGVLDVDRVGVARPAALHLGQPDDLRLGAGGVDAPQRLQRGCRLRVVHRFAPSGRAASASSSRWVISRRIE
jgi:hypothetical protein